MLLEYIRELSAFYDRLETNPLSANAVLTWHALMHTNNKCFWAKEFAVAVSVLSLKTGGLSRRSIERARNELAQKGLIEWRERAGCQSATYSMISIVRLRDAQSVAQPDVQPDVQPDAQCVAQPDAITSYPTDTQKTNTKKNTKTNTKPARDARSDVDSVFDKFAGEDGTLRKALEDFADMRRTNKKPLTASAAELITAKLKGLSPDPAEQARILDQSTMNSWQGIFPVKDGAGGPTTAKSLHRPPVPTDPSINPFRTQSGGDAHAKCI